MEFAYQQSGKNRCFLSFIVSVDESKKKIGYNGLEIDFFLENSNIIIQI